MTANPGARRAPAAVSAALWMTGSLAAISSMAIAGRELGRTLPILDMMFHRSWIATLMVGGLAVLTTGGLGCVATRRLPLHAWRNATHFAAQGMWFWAVTQIPLADLFALEFTTPLWLALIAPLIIAERLTWARFGAVVLGFAGALLVVRPTGAGISLGSAAALGSAIGYAFSIIGVKQLTRTESALTILFWMSLVQFIYALLLSLPHLSWPPPQAFAWIVAIAIGGLAAHYCMARAFALADTLIVAPMDYLRLPLIAVVGALAYAEAFDAWVLCGGGIIIAANLINIWVERRR